MKIKTTATVEAEVEVEVDIADVLNELCDRMDDADPGRWRVVTPAIETLVRLVDRIDGMTIAAMPLGVRDIICERFSEIATRFKVKK